MRLKLDENLGERGLEALRQAGHDVCTTRAQNLQAALDPELLGRCIIDGRALITFDLDLANPLLYPPDRHEGVAVIRMPRKPTRADLEGAIETLIAALRTQSLERQLWIVENGRIRVYSPGR